MSNWVNVEGAVKDLKKLSSQLTGKQLAIGISRGINRTLMKGRTAARSAVKSEYNIPQKNLNGINFNRSNSYTLTGSIYASSKPIPMDAFSPVFHTVNSTVGVSKKGVQTVKGRKRKSKAIGQGVSIEVHRGSRQVVPFAFMLVGQKPRVFARGEYPIGSYGFVQRHTRKENDKGNDSVKPLVSTTVHAAVINPVSIGKIRYEMNEHFPKELTAQLKFLIGKLPKTATI